MQVIDPDDLPQRARWTIIATACLLLFMCLLLVGVTLRMAPLIDDMGKSFIIMLSAVVIQFVTEEDGGAPTGQFDWIECSMMRGGGGD